MDRFAVFILIFNVFCTFSYRSGEKVQKEILVKNSEIISLETEVKSLRECKNSVGELERQLLDRDEHLSTNMKSLHELEVKLASQGGMLNHQTQLLHEQELKFQAQEIVLQSSVESEETIALKERLIEKDLLLVEYKAYSEKVEKDMNELEETVSSLNSDFVSIRSQRYKGLLLFHYPLV